MGFGEKLGGLIFVLVGGWLFYNNLSGGVASNFSQDVLIGYITGTILVLIGLYMLFRKPSHWPYHQ